jgi:phosphatidylserine/phosphatidylglycerophosphate/cardiolipin synthase-like enzyme
VLARRARAGGGLEHRIDAHARLGRRYDVGLEFLKRHQNALRQRVGGAHVRVAVDAVGVQARIHAEVHRPRAKVGEERMDDERDIVQQGVTSGSRVPAGGRGQQG